MTTQEIINQLEEKANKYQLENERQYKEDRENINVVLRGDNKYYYARQCAKFTKYVTENGFDKWITKEDIAEHGLSFNKYSITNDYNQYGRDIKRFDSKDEMLGFVIGYNIAKGV
tara:strand:+ start:303 stop:647 length:345 start_codon:yes stop_codon:yes gene_type:complete